jgi:iron complex outermembrane receptor protein
VQIKKLSALFTSLTLSCSSFAAEEATSLDELLAMDLGEILEVQVATGTKKQVSDAPAVVSVITADDIKAMGVRTLAEAVERVPGLHINVSPTRMNTLFSVRGIQSFGTPQVLVLFDGVEISEMAQMAIPYSFRYPVNNIERIEIIRGPGSAVYGADAVSGVINVITKSPEQAESVEMGLNLGSFDYLEGWVNANKSFEDFSTRLSVTYEKQNNDDDRRTQYGVLDRRREMSNIHFDVNYGNFTLKNWYYEVRQQMGNGAGLVGNNLDRDNTEFFKIQLNWQGEIHDDLVGAYDISHSRNKFDGFFQLFPPGTWPVGADGNLFLPPFTPVEFPDGVIGNPSGKSSRSKLNTSFVYSGINDHRIRVGVGGEDSAFHDIGEIKNFGPGILDVDNLPADLIAHGLVDVTGTPFVYTPRYDRQLWYVSVQDEWRINEDWELTTGVRFDHFSDFGSTTNPRVALVWESTETLTSKLLFGTAFRAPRAAELVFINNPASLGRPNLQPEEIQTLELAFDYRPTKHFTGLLNIFSYEAEQLIALDQTFTFDNIGEQDGRGVEVEAKWQATNKLSIDANMSWLDADLPLLDEDRAEVPGLMGFVDLRYQLSEQWLVTSQSYWIANRERESADHRSDIDDYVKTDVTLIWQPNEQWTGRLSVRNLFDDNVREPSPNSPLFGIGLGFPGDFPMESRSIFASFSYTL